METRIDNEDGRMPDPHAHLAFDPPEPCPHGNGEDCECKLPKYRGLFVLPITKDGGTRRVIGKMQQAREGGMRQFTDPINDNVVGCCGCNFAFEHVMTLEAWSARHADVTPPSDIARRSIDAFIIAVTLLTSRRSPS